MNREQQDQLWNELSEESKKAILEEYDDGSFDDWNGIQALEVTFGKHNLNPKPPTPKTYDDIAKDKPFELADVNPKIHNKVIATAMIAELIEKGYGGMVSEEEWKDFYTPKYGIYCNQKGELIIGIISAETEAKRTLIAFHTEFQLKEFMSHESNRKLVEMYYLM